MITNGIEFMTALACCYCLDLEAFQKIFEGQAGHLWEKFQTKYEGDVCGFVCSLDSENCEALFNWLNETGDFKRHANHIQGVSQ